LDVGANPDPIGIDDGVDRLGGRGGARAGAGGGGAHAGGTSPPPAAAGGGRPEPVPPTWLRRATTRPVNGALTEARRSPALGSSSTIVPPIGIESSWGILTTAISWP